MSDEGLRSSSELTVSFTLKEVLLRIESEIREIRGAFMSSIEKLEGRVTALETESASAARERSSKKMIRDNWIALVALIAAVAASWAAFFGPLHH